MLVMQEESRPIFAGRLGCLHNYEKFTNLVPVLRQ